MILNQFKYLYGSCIYMGWIACMFYFLVGAAMFLRPIKPDDIDELSQKPSKKYSLRKKSYDEFDSRTDIESLKLSDYHGSIKEAFKHTEYV